MNLYWNLKESYNSCDYIWDFFQQDIVRYSYARLWNSENPENKINPKEFDIFNTQHLDFIRAVFENSELWEKFLIYLKSYSIKLTNIKQFNYDTKQVVSFILIWIDVKERICAYSESLSTIFQEKVFETLNASSGIEVVNSWWYEVNRFMWLESLVSSWFQPISEYWDILYWIEDGWIFGFFQVINNDWDKYYIDKTWKILSEEDVEKLQEKSIPLSIEIRECIIAFIKWEEIELDDYMYDFMFQKQDSLWFDFSKDTKQALEILEQEIRTLKDRKKAIQRWNLKVIN